MVVELGSVAFGATGNETVLLSGTETPSFIDFWVGPESGTVETADMRSTGCVDIANNFATYQCNFSDNTGAITRGGDGTSTGFPCIRHYVRQGGSMTRVIDWTFVSAASGQFTINVNSVNPSSANYVVYFKVYG